MKTILAAVIGIMLLTSCDQLSGNSETDLIRHVENNELEGIKSYWLEKNGIGRWFKVILVFGFQDNQGVCKRLIEGERKLETKGRGIYRCTLAN